MHFQGLLLCKWFHVRDFLVFQSNVILVSDIHNEQSVVSVVQVETTTQNIPSVIPLTTQTLK